MLDKTVLLRIIETKMPFGKYKDKWLYEIPVSYLEWMRNNNGFPKGQLGMLMETLFVIKTNGLDFLLKPLIAEAKSKNPK